MPKRDIARPLREHAQWVDEAMHAPIETLTTEQFEYRLRVLNKQCELELGLFADRFNKTFAESPGHEERIPIW